MRTYPELQTGIFTRIFVWFNRNSWEYNQKCHQYAVKKHMFYRTQRLRLPFRGRKCCICPWLWQIYRRTAWIKKSVIKMIFFIGIGVEQGLLSSAKDKINNYDPTGRLDFIIGSSHLVYGNDLIILNSGIMCTVKMQ